VKPIIHFEDGLNRPDVFRITRAQVNAARRRNPAAAGLLRFSHGNDLESVDRWLPRAEGLVISGGFLTQPRFPLRDLAVRAPKLRWIHVIGAGVENLMPLDWLRPGLVLTNNSGVHAGKVHQFGLMALLMLNTRAPQMMTNQRNHAWKPIFTGSLEGKSLLVVGLGDMGGGVARAGKGLGMTVTGIRRSAKPHPYAQKVHPAADLHKLLPKADIVALAPPLTPETQRIMGAKEFALMKPGAALINIGRGPHVDQAALEKALRSGRLSGAVIDVTDPEPLPAASKLWDVPNLFIMPHCSSDDADAYMPGTLDLALRNAALLARGRALKNAVDPARGY
jgi:phosphoglycerate dehydrogenase-like enzyme